MAYDRDEWRTPWRSTATTPGGASAPPVGSPDVPDDEPIARFPQPPPATWDAGAAGPGSPPGSVRPPDTTGTHDAPPAPQRRGRTFLIALIGGLIGALIGAGGVGAFLVQNPPPGGSTTAPTIQVNGEHTSIVPAVAQAVLPSVVSIDVPASTVTAGGPGVESLGSGVIYRSDGYILTNNHVVGEATEVVVRLSSGDALAGEVIGTDPLNDLAVIKVDATGLPAINQRDMVEDELLIGETVVAIGSPFGLDGSVTTGIVSGLNRDLPAGEEEGAGLTIPFVIQTDAAINPGNSGGALVDAQGRLIGINTAILTRTGGSQGVGFAVPADQVLSSADQIIEFGFATHPLLGISGRDVSPAIAEEFGLESARGAIVETVQDGTGAATAGLRPNDVIIAVDGEPLSTMSNLVAEVRRRAPGDEVRLTVVRDGDRLELDVTLSERPRD